MERIYPDELYHYGIKGMKWGVRRYQNEDGTRTALGKMRERKGNGTRKEPTPEQKAKRKKFARGAAIAGGVAAGFLARAARAEKRGDPERPLDPRKWSQEEKDYWFKKELTKKGNEKPSRAEKFGKKADSILRKTGNITGTFERKQQAKMNAEERAKYRKEASRMTDDDLRKRINRMNLEKQYVDLSSYKEPSARWSAQEKMNLGVEALETLAEVGTLAFMIYKARH